MYMLYPDGYSRATEIINSDHPAVSAKARDLAAGLSDSTAIARRCFEWVRDHVRHSGEHDCQVVTVKASEVLEHRTGVCYAKSHLLAALLRANGIPAGLCYQRLYLDPLERFGLHGLTAVYLPDRGWYRMDPRGNNDQVHADFRPPQEQLPYAPGRKGELDLPEVWPDPLPVVVTALRRCRTIPDLCQNLPDVELW
jgi:hypothetical protein